jgi:hypothetical protein
MAKTVVKRVKRVIQRVINYFRGREAGVTHTSFPDQVIYELYTRIWRAYEDKSQGRTDDLGNSWKPLSQTTIRNRLSKDASGRFPFARSKQPRPSLNSKHDKQWRAIYAKEVARLAPLVGLMEAKPRAAQLAWNIVKSKGAKTTSQLLEQYRGKVHILVDTGRLQKSFAPGVVTSSGYIPPNSDQKYEIRNHEYVIGSNVPYYKEVAEVRPIIPDNHSKWVEESIREAIRKLT